MSSNEASGDSFVTNVNRNADSDDSEGETCDTLAPLPEDLLVHAAEPTYNEDNIISHRQTDQPPHKQSSKKSSSFATHRRSIDATSGRPIFPARNPTQRDLLHARKLLQALEAKFGFTAPDRGNLDDPSILWREGKPDYTIADLHYYMGKSKNHSPGSLELTVENLVKTWEMEATHKEFYQWTTVDKDSYEVQANGGKVFSAVEAPWVGNYNWLLSTVKSTDLYDSTKETFESSHGKFRYAFPEGFPFEVLEVFSGPPKIAFTWRHWAIFSGEYMNHKGSGETINLTGFGVAEVNSDTKITRLEIYYDPDSFLEVLSGRRESRDGKDKGVCVGESIAGGPDALAFLMAEIEMDDKEDSDDRGERKDNNNGPPSFGTGRGRCPFTGAS